jgi:aldose sugar dehydrogenase
VASIIYAFVFALFICSFLSIVSDRYSYSVYASSDPEDENGPKIVEDPNLKVELVLDLDLDHPTNMAFLGKDDIVVPEKDRGTVQRIVNGDMVEQPLLDVDVANQVERGLLGIAVAKHPSATYVFLYYTKSSDEKDGSDECESRNHCEIGQPIGHSLYRYELEDNKLINPKLLLDLPTNPGADHVGGVIMVGPDNNIYLVTGDGDSCQRGCNDGIKDSVINAQTANVNNGNAPEGRGGILRVTQDGQPVGKGILGDEYPLNLYYAYGIRNSFGMDFDPLTGNLWDTENGPGYGDEINLAEPGFNSGWYKAQAMWPVTSYEQLDPSPKERGYFGETELSENEISKRLIDFNGNGKYSNPELAWNITQGVTAIKFFNSDTLGEAYENDMFVGDVRSGNLYHFDLNEDRTQLELKGRLSDKVLNSIEELEETIFAKGFPSIVDIEISPDGYLYILTYGGSIYRIVKN